METTTRISGEHGPVKDITCRVEEVLTIVNDGIFKAVEDTNKFDTERVPMNCPRDQEFDPKKELGCLICTLGRVDFMNGMSSFGRVE